MVKQPAHVKPEKIDDRQIEWSFHYFDNYVWHDGEYRATPFIEIGSHLKSYGKFTWKEVRCRDPKRDHPISPDRIINDAKKRLETVTRGQFDELWRFRFGSQPRIWGVKIEHVFHVLWWDPQHKICPSELKNT